MLRECPMPMYTSMIAWEYSHLSTWLLVAATLHVIFEARTQTPLSRNVPNKGDRIPRLINCNSALRQAAIFLHKNTQYCISYILHVVWLSVVTIRLSIHRWGRDKIFSLSTYESPSNRQDQVFPVPRLPDNPALQWGCYVDCFQRSCRDIAGSGKTYNFLFLVIIIMVLSQGCVGDLFDSLVFSF